MMSVLLKVGRDLGGRTTLISPCVGVWYDGPGVGDTVLGGSTIGAIRVLGRHYAVVVPDGVNGVVLGLSSADRKPQRLDYGGVLLTLSSDWEHPEMGRENTPRDHEDDAAVVGGDNFLFRSESGGRYYSRSGPDKPAFISTGDEIDRGQTVFLIEIMKTFNRIAYRGDDLPERAKVVRILVSDGDELELGQPVLELEAL